MFVGCCNVEYEEQTIEELKKVHKIEIEVRKFLKSRQQNGNKNKWTRFVKILLSIINTLSFVPLYVPLHENCLIDTGAFVHTFMQDADLLDKAPDRKSVV